MASRNHIWKHETKFKGQLFVAGYEYSKKLGKRVMKFKNKNTGREIAETYGNGQQAEAAGWKKVD